MSVQVVTHDLSKNTPSQIPPVLLDFEQQSMLLRDLISLTVTEQVNELAFRLAAEHDAAESAAAERAAAAADVSHHYLLSGSLPAPTPQRAPTAETAIGDALRAFESNRFVVLVDGDQIDDLDQVVEVPAGTSVTFLRLTPLKGG